MDVIERALWEDSEIQASVDDALLPQWSGNLSQLNGAAFALSNGEAAVIQTTSPSADQDTTSRSRRGRQSTKGSTSGSSTYGRRREEINLLRVAAEHLELQLDHLLDKAAVNRERKPGLNWRLAASKLRNEREQAERENTKLRNMLQVQNNVRHQLELFLTLCRTQLKESPSNWLPPPPPRSIIQEGHAILDALARVLDAMHAQTDTMLCDPRLKSTTTSMNHAEAKHQQDPYCLVVQRVESRMMPFDAPRTAAAVWRTFAEQAKVPRSDWGHETVQSQFVMYATHPGFKGHVQANMTLRRIQESSGRVVLLRSSVFIILSPPCGQRMSGELTSTRHLSWLTISPLSQVKRGCQMQICDLYAPLLDDKTENAMPAPAKLYVTLSNHLGEDMQNQIDDTLLRTTTQGPAYGSS